MLDHLLAPAFSLAAKVQMSENQVHLVHLQWQEGVVVPGPLVVEVVLLVAVVLLVEQEPPVQAEVAELVVLSSVEVVVVVVQSFPY